MMIEKLPLLDLSDSRYSSCSTSRSRLERTNRDDQPQSEAEIWENDIKIVNLQYFKTREIFCTVSRQKEKIQAYCDKNSLLLTIWVYLLKKQYNQPITVIEQDLPNLEQNLKMIRGVPHQMRKYNNSKTIKDFIINALKLTNKSRMESEFCFQRTILQILIDYPFFVYSGLCYIRAKGLLHLRNNFNKYQLDLIGNEQSFLADYSVELKNMPLELIADSLNLSIEMTYDQRIQMIGKGDNLLKIEKAGNSYRIQLNTELYGNKRQKGSSQFVSTVTGSSHQFQKLPVNRICNRCLNIKTGKFCECRKKKVVVDKTNKTKQKQIKTYNKKYCSKCELQYTFVCKCYLD